MEMNQQHHSQEQLSSDSSMPITYEALSDGSSPSVVGSSNINSGPPLMDHYEQQRGPWPAMEWLFWPPTATVGPVSKAATAQAMDSVAKGVMHASAAFFGPALLQLAFDQVQRQEQNRDCVDNEDRCDLLWGFWRPSAVLTTSSVIAVLSASIGIPFLGAYIDRQRYDQTQDHGRYTAGKLTAYCLAFIHLAQMFVHKSTWFVFWISHTIAEALNMVHQMYVIRFLFCVSCVLHLRYSQRLSLSPLSFTLFLALMRGSFWRICKM